MKPRARLSVVSSSPTDRLPLSEEVARFHRHAEAKGLSPATVRFYRQRLDSFVKHPRPPARASPEGVTPELVRGFLAAKHRQASPGDRFMAAGVKGGRRRRLR